MTPDMRYCRYCGAIIIPSRIGSWWRRLTDLPGYGISQCPARQGNAGTQPLHEPTPAGQSPTSDTQTSDGGS